MGIVAGTGVRARGGIDGMRSAIVALAAVGVLGGCAGATGRGPSSPGRPVAASGSSAAPVGAPPGAGSAPAAGGNGSAGATAATSPGARPDNATLKPFREVVAGAKEFRGWLALWQKDDKVWIEIPEDRLDQPFFFSYNVSESVGERGAYAAQMGRRHVVVFHRVGNAMQLIARNTRFAAVPGSPAETAVRQSFSDSLVGSAPVLSQPHPARKSVLIDASALLMTDIAGYSTTLESAFHINYSLDRANSSFTKVRNDDRSATLAVRDHFSIARLPGIVPPNNPIVPIPPSTTPDARSLFVGFVYNFMALPEPMRPRYADDRVGYFTTTIADYASDDAPNARRFYVDRWRLEKKDPGAARSDPKEPIVFWVDRNVPVAYRQTIVDGILVWNRAFERIGFSNAIVAKIEPDDADFDTLDARHASVRWFLGADVGFAIGPSHTDPRTGEILDADIAIPDIFTRNAKTLVTEALPQPPRPLPGSLVADDPSLFCDYASEAVGEAAFALGLLDARGDVPADSAAADAFAKAYLRGVVTHEVGHTLGLRHNFHASTIHSEAVLQDAAFTRTHGLTGSVMDYTPFNVATRDEHQGEYVMSGLGPYDYWAIAYAYTPVAGAKTPDDERAALSAIAARSTDPALAFATDEDADAGPDGMDPDVNRFDLGSDPLAYYRKRFELSHELWDRLQRRPMRPDESFLVLRRNVERGFNEIGRAVPLIAKYVGGVRTSRNHVAAAPDGAVALQAGAPLFVPVDAKRQKQALDLLASQLFSVDSFRFDPDFVARLGIDYLDRGDRNGNNQDTFYLPGRVLSIQTQALDHLMSDPVARRIGDAENISRRPRDLLTLSQLYGTLQRAVWSELWSGRDITRMRRNLQREHLKRVVAVVIRPSTPTIADARSLERDQAIALRDAAARALAAGRLSPDNRAHLRETVASIDDALKANMTKTGA